MKPPGFTATTTCDECPWRTDVPPGRFPPERFKKLASSCEGGIGKPMFACHKSPEDAPFACVGYLIVEGPEENLGVRLALIQHKYDPAKLVATGPLYESFDAMARANGVKVKAKRGKR